MRLHEFVEVTITTATHLTCDQRTLTHSLVNISGQFTLLVCAHLLRTIPVMLIEPLGLAVTLAIIVVILILLEVIVNLSGVPPRILGVVAPTLGHLGPAIFAILGHDLVVDDIVTGYVGHAWVLFVEVSPRCQMTIQLVIHLVQDEEPQLSIVEPFHKLSTIHLVTSVGAGCRNLGLIVFYCAITDHDDT